MWTLRPCRRRLILKDHLRSTHSNPVSRVSGGASIFFGESSESQGVDLGLCNRASALCCVRLGSHPLASRSQEPSDTKCASIIALSGFTGFQDVSLHPLYSFFLTFNKGFPRRTRVEGEVSPRMGHVFSLSMTLRALTCETQRDVPSDEVTDSSTHERPSLFCAVPWGGS